ncbi:hypothetical protein BLNAU_24357 [Blattamonas nauphoetae]|uniref:Uncharacterized protein n=1 Tax=Blattamonas nauphoetae TaxID=2049346 RepID=A0ABQ9WML9_9EUKA|nr:hypothetical protein BLNAU_24357 [Blattamonas nauphoetae]
MSGCRFQQQSTSGSGAVVLDSLSLVLTVFDSTFSENTAKTEDASFFIAISRLSIVAISMTMLRLLPLQKQSSSRKLPTADELAHYRGNDLFGTTQIVYSATGTANIVGCSSTSVSPKIGYYTTPSANGVHRNESTLLRDPETGSVQPPASAVFFVESNGSDEAPLECSEVKPCQSFSAALSKITNATSPSKDSFNLVNLGVGSFSEGRHELSNSVELAGMGWMANQTHHTLLTTSGMEVVGSGNVSFSSLLLKPSTKSDTLLKMASNGSSDTPHDLVHIHHSKGGDGGSCLDSATSGTISISMSDFADCSSAGKAGALTLTAHSTQPTITLQTTIFSRNRGTQASDLIATGLASSKLSIASTTRSMSSMPHCLLNTTERRLQYPDVSFTENSAPHPLNARFNRGTPMSLFPGFAVYFS